MYDEERSTFFKSLQCLLMNTPNSLSINLILEKKNSKRNAYSFHSYTLTNNMTFFILP